MSRATPFQASLLRDATGAILQALSQHWGSEWKPRRYSTGFRAGRKFDGGEDEFHVDGKVGYDDWSIWFYVGCAVRWDNITEIKYLDFVHLSKKEMQDMCSIFCSIGNLSIDDVNLSCQKKSQIPKLSNYIKNYFEKAERSFFGHYRNYRYRKNMFYDFSPEVLNLVLFPDDVSKIAIAIAYIEESREFLLDLIEKHRKIINNNYPECSEKFSLFMDKFRLNYLA